MGISFIAHTDTRVLQIQLLSIPIPQIAPKSHKWDWAFMGTTNISLAEPCLTLIVPRAWEIGYTQPCIKCRVKSATHFVYFWSRKTLPYTHLEATSYIPQQDQSIHIWTTSLSTTGCYKNKYTIQFLWMACISRFAAAISSGETELALGTIRVNFPTHLTIVPTHFIIVSLLYYSCQFSTAFWHWQLR